MLKKKNSVAAPASFAAGFLAVFFTAVLLGGSLVFTEKNFWKLATELLNRINQSNGGTDTIRNILLTIKSFTRFDAVAIRLRKGDDFPYYVTKGFSDEFVAREKERRRVLLAGSNGGGGL